jgi:hypothetical protein
MYQHTKLWFGYQIIQQPIAIIRFFKEKIEPQHIEVEVYSKIK